MIVVKVQVSLDKDRSGRGLVYGPGRVMMSEQELPPAAIEALGADLKGYFKASFEGDRWVLGDRVAAQPW